MTIFKLLLVYATTAVAIAAAEADAWRILYNQGVHSLAQGEPRAAVDEFAGANRLQPQNPYVLYGLSAAEFAAGQSGAATESIHKLLGLKDAPFDLLMGAGELLASRQMNSLAAEAYQAARQKAPSLIGGQKSSVFFENTLAALAARSQNDNELAQHLRSLLKTEPDQPVHYYELGLVLIKNAAFQPAFQLLQAAQIRFPKTPEILLVYAIASYLAGHANLAEQAYLELARLQPDTDQAYFALGNFYGDEGRDGEAAAAFHRAIDVNPRNYQNHYMYAVTLARLQDWQGAAGEFQKTLALDPAHADSYYWLGKMDLQNGKNEPAKRAFERAVSLEPKHLGAWYQLGRLYQREGLTEKARVAFEKQRALRKEYDLGSVALRMP
ncbi:MAG: tetratricopeptide repeat protein [Acidobacteriaceae bacterium]|nr:tetratricopeptide repeat protein [Acidobacteriaceae bacterium]